MLTNISVALALLRSHPFRTLPLHVKCFREDVYRTFMRLAQADTGKDGLFKSTPATVVANVRSLPALDSRVQVTFNPFGYAASFFHGGRRSQPEDEHGSSGDSDLLDLRDGNFRAGERSGGKWRRLQLRVGQQLCCLCATDINTTVSAKPL